MYESARNFSDDRSEKVLNYHTTRPDKHGRGILIICKKKNKKKNKKKRYFTVAYTGQVTFYKVPKHGHV